VHQTRTGVPLRQSPTGAQPLPAEPSRIHSAVRAPVKDPESSTMCVPRCSMRHPGGASATSPDGIAALMSAYTCCASLSSCLQGTETADELKSSFEPLTGIGNPVPSAHRQQLVLQAAPVQALQNAAPETQKSNWGGAVSELCHYCKQIGQAEVMGFAESQTWAAARAQVPAPSPIGCCWSYLTSRIGWLFPVWQQRGRSLLHH
jgi:hypothetical protein